MITPIAVTIDEAAQLMGLHPADVRTLVPVLVLSRRTERVLISDIEEFRSGAPVIGKEPGIAPLVWPEPQPRVLLGYAESARRSAVRRRARKAGTLGLEVVRVSSDDCAICTHPIDKTLKWPHPYSASVGHEPPLSRLRELRSRSVTERPEHLRCNLSKGSRLDSEMR